MASIGFVLWAAGMADAAIDDWAHVSYNARWFYLTAGIGCVLFAISEGSEWWHGVYIGVFACSAWVAISVVSSIGINLQKGASDNLWQRLRYNGDIDLAFFSAFPLSVFTGATDLNDLLLIAMFTWFYVSIFMMLWSTWRNKGLSWQYKTDMGISFLVASVCTGLTLMFLSGFFFRVN